VPQTRKHRNRMVTQGISRGTKGNRKGGKKDKGGVDVGGKRAGPHFDSKGLKMMGKNNLGTD